MSGYNKPNYTQIPNILLDEHLPEMGHSELKVTLAIARKTFGWQKDSDKLSLSQLAKLTGLSRQGVIDGIDAGVNRGTIIREPNGNSFSYSLLVNDLDQKKCSSQQIRLPETQMVNELDHLLVNELDTQKKLIKKNNNNNGDGDSGDSPIWADIARMYESEIGMFTAITSEMVQEDFDEFGGRWLADAIRIAVQANTRKWSYVRGILRNWKVNGRQDRQSEVQAEPVKMQVVIVDGKPQLKPIGEVA